MGVNIHMSFCKIDLKLSMELSFPSLHGATYTHLCAYMVEIVLSY
jgi:hypothetical protein